MTDTAKSRTWARYTALALIATAVPFAAFDLAHAQSIMRTPSINIDTRVPTINPTVAPRVDPNIAGRVNTINNTAISVDRVTPRITPRINPNSTMPNARFSPNLQSACDAANRDASGECTGNPIASRRQRQWRQQQERWQAGEEGQRFRLRCRAKCVRPDQLSQPVRCRDRWRAE